MRKQIIETTLDILRDTADDIEQADDIDTTSARLVIRASAYELELEIKRLNDALVSVTNNPCNAEIIAREALAA